MKAKPTKSRKVEAFLCSECETLHRTEIEAYFCCACSTCKTKFPHANTFQTQCGHCRYGSDLRDARAAVRREEASLGSAKSRLVRLLANKRPPKGSAP